MIFLLKWAISALSILVIAYLIPGVIVTGFWTALFLVVIFGLLNATIKPLLLLLTLPINILTLGLFSFVINAVIVMLASMLVGGFEIGGFFNAFLFSLILVIFQSLFEVLFRKNDTSRS